MSVKKHILLNGLVLAFLGLQLTLGVRTMALEDARLGWGMFCYQTNYTVSYEWLLGDGTTRKQAALDLAGRTLKYLSDVQPHRTRYGRGAIRGWMTSYLRYLHERYRPADAIGVQSVVTYRINKLGDWRELVVRFPEVGTT